MQQLELFPNDIVRFATELSHAELQSLKDHSHVEYHRIKAIRMAVNRHESHIKHLDKKLDFEINDIIGGRYV